MTGAARTSGIFGVDPLVVARVPLLPYRTVAELFDAPDWGAYLRTLFDERPEAAAAIEISSPPLGKTIRRWLAGGTIDRRALLRIAAFVLRMSSRTTPFGTFASVGLADVGADATLTLTGEYATTTSPDVGLLLEAASAALAADAPLTVNRDRVDRGTRVYATAMRHTFDERVIQKAQAAFVTRSVRRTAFVDAAIALCSAEALTWDALAQAVSAFLGADAERCRNGIAELIDSGVLVAERRVPFPPSARAVLATLAAAKGVHGAETLIAALSDFDTKPLRDKSADHVRALNEHLVQTFDQPDGRLHVTLSHRSEGTLPRKVLDDVEILARMLFGHPYRRVLRRYREKFYARYESYERRIPLLDLVSPEFGIGPVDATDSDRDEDVVARQERLVGRLVSEALRDGTRVIRLDDAMFAALYKPLEDLNDVPGDFDVAFSLYATDLGAIDAGNYLLEPSALGGSQGGLRAMARFPGVGDTARYRETAERLDAAAEAENEVVAELVFLPARYKHANLIVRPVVTPYQIAVGCAPQAGPARPIELADIEVGVSNRRFFLYSRSLGRRIRIRETMSFNTDRWATDIVRSISMIARDGLRPAMRLSLNDRFGAVHVPRIQYGRVVLRAGSWAIPDELFAKGPAWRDALVGWRARWNVPRAVRLVHVDQVLQVDFESDLSLDVLRDQMRHDYLGPQQGLRFEESLETTDALWLRRGGERMHAEFVAVGSSSSPGPPREPIRPEATSASYGARVVGIPDGWFFAKLFCAEHRADELIRAGFGTVADAESRQSLFFTRFADPQEQLRVRMRTSPAFDLGRTIEAVHELVRAGAIERYSIDTYSREVERYGGVDCIAHAEALFALSSDLVAGALGPAVRGGREIRIESAAISAAHLVGPWTAAVDVTAWLEAFGRTTDRAHRVDRAAVPRMARALRSAGDDARACDAVAQIRSASVTRSSDAVLDSVLHMHFNRWSLAPSEELRARTLIWHGVRSLASDRRRAPQARVETIVSVATV